MNNIKSKNKKPGFTRAKGKTAQRKQKAAIKSYYAEKKTEKKSSALSNVVKNLGRVFDKNKNPRVPLGRTLSTYDKYLDKNTTSDKERPVVVIETNDYDELAVVALTTQQGSHRTRLPHYQQGQSYYKHFVEIEDSEGKPIKINEKFRENSLLQDVSKTDVEKIRKRVFSHVTPVQENRKKIEKFRLKKKSPQD